MLRSLFAVLLAAALGLPFVACATRRPVVGQEVSGLDRKLSTFAFIEDGELLTFIVGTRAARYRDESPYMPLEIAIANRGVRALLLTRESFTLIDEEGTRYPAATPNELIESYQFLDLDRNALAELEGIVDTKFAALRKYPSQFSPTRTIDLTRSTVVRDSVSLPKYGYLIDYLYFPRPRTGIKDHRFELFLESRSLPDPVFVKFAVE